MRSAPAWIAAVLLLVILGLLVEFGRFFGLDHSLGDRLAAIGAVLGGLIGAGGAALAVYLTLVSQRKDEAAKVEESLQAEVAEFARLAVGPLAILTPQVARKGPPMPLEDIPEITDLPEPVVFKAAADRLSRLSYGPLLVTFYVRIAEAKQMAKLLGLRIPISHRGSGILPLGPQEAKMLTTAWYDICVIARIILRSEPSARQLVEAGRAESLRSLDESIGQAEAVLNPDAGKKPPRA